jgi:hypothetical protein
MLQLLQVLVLPLLPPPLLPSLCQRRCWAAGFHRSCSWPPQGSCVATSVAGPATVQGAAWPAASAAPVAAGTTCSRTEQSQTIDESELHLDLLDA